MRRRKALASALVILGVLVALVVVLVMTPLGWRLATGLIEGAVDRETGLDLTIGSLRGNLLSDVTIADATLGVPDGPTILEIEEIEGTYSLAALVRGRVEVPGLRISNARLLFEVGPDGELAGWSRFLKSTPDTAAAAEPWPIDVNLALSDWTIVVRDTAAGYEIEVAGLDADAWGGPDDFRASLVGSLAVAARALSRPVRGSLRSAISGDGSSIRIALLEVPTDAGRVAVKGLVSFGGAVPSLDLAIESAVDLGALSSLARPEGAGEHAGPVAEGPLDILATVEGPVDSIRYRARVSGSDLAVGPVAAPRAVVDLAGDLARVDVERFAVSVFGGEVAGRAAVDLTALGDAPPRAPYDLSATITGLDLGRLKPLLREGGTAPGGVLSGWARLAAGSADPRDLEGSFDVVVSGFSVGDTLLGDLSVEGAIADGRLEALGRCCAIAVTADAALEADGIHAVGFTAGIADLSVAGTAFGFPEIGGRGSVEGTLAFGPDGTFLTADASLPELSYRGFEIGPARIAATGRDTAYAVGFRAFGDVVEGDGAFTAGGAYRVSARVDSFDLSTVMDEALRRRLEFEGSVSAAVTVSGRGQEPPAIEGTVIDLYASARGERAYLATPFQFTAARDTVHVTWAALEGTFGSLSVTGGMSVRESGEIVARLEDIDLAAVAKVLPDGLPAALRGTVEGDVRIFGRRDRPSFRTDVVLDDFAYGALALRTVTFEAHSDSSDVLYDLRAESAVAGSVAVYGSFPVAPDSLRFVVPDPTGEFGVSMVLSDFTVDAGGSLLPGIRGSKRFSADGAALLVGRADSLGSIYGRGSFGALSATFDLVEIAISDTLEFDLAGGAVELRETAVAVTPRRTLAKEVAGTALVGGVVRSDGTMDLSTVVERLDVGQLIRAFGPEPRATVTGKLDLAAEITGTVESPEVGFAWRLDRPAFSGFGFDSFSGRGALAGDVVTIEEGVLASRDRTLSVTGAIPIPGGAADGESESRGRELAVRVEATDFRLDRLAKLPPGLEAMSGSVDVDLTLAGTIEAPRPSGNVKLRDGSIRGFDLKEPIRDIAFDLSVGDDVMVLSNARATLGGGSIAAIGAAQVLPGTPPTFHVRIDLESPEIKVEDTFEARLGGRLTWAGSPARSEVSGRVIIEELNVIYDVGLLDVLTRKPVAIVIRRADEPASRIALDLTVDIEDEVTVKNSLARLALKGGLEIRGTALAPRVTGRLDAAEGGTFKYLDNRFDIESLEVVFIDPNRRDPYVHLVGSATVIDRSEEEYLITVVFDGYAFETLPQFTSEPPLSEGDIIALLTFGDTFGGLAAGPAEAGSSGDRFRRLARGAFIANVFGVAESTLERILHLDTLAVDEEAVANEGLVGADVTIGKVFGDRLRVNYTTAVGEFGEQEVEVAFRLSRQLSIETRADPEGNHAIGLRLRIPFK